MTITIWSLAYLAPLAAYTYHALVRRRTLVDPLLLGGAYLCVMFLFEGARRHSLPTSYLLLLHSGCSAAYWLGGSAGYRWARRFRGSKYGWREPLVIRRSAWLAAMAAALGLLVFVLMFSHEGSLGVLLEMRKRPDLLLGSVTSRISLLERLSQYLRGYVAPLGTLGVLFWCRQKRPGLMSTAALAVVLIGWGALGIGGGSRGAILFLLIQCIFAIRYARGRNPVTQAAARVVVALLLPIGAFLILAQTLYRHTGLPADAGLAQLQQRSSEAGRAILEQVSFNDEVGFVLSTYPNYYSYTGGHSIRTPLVVFVPRTVWAEKPVPWGRILAWQYGFRYDTTVSMAATIPGEGYANFGLAGWVLFPMVFGMIIGATLHYLRNSRDEFDIVTGLWGLFWALSLRGDLHTALASIIIPYLIVAIGFRWCAFRQRKGYLFCAAEQRPSGVRYAPA